MVLIVIQGCHSFQKELFAFIATVHKAGQLWIPLGPPPWLQIPACKLSSHAWCCGDLEQERCVAPSSPYLATLWAGPQPVMSTRYSSFRVLPWHGYLLYLFCSNRTGGNDQTVGASLWAETIAESPPASS
jgi:hypothetical protein